MTSNDELIPTRRSMRRQPTSLEAAPTRRTAPRPEPRPRWSRRRGVTGAFAAFAVVGFAAAYLGPTSAVLTGAFAAEPVVETVSASAFGDPQVYTSLEAADDAAPASLDRDSYSVYVKPKPTPTPTPVVAAAPGATKTAWQPPFVAPDPGSAQAIAYGMVTARGWSDAEFACLVSLWNKESGWRVNAFNKGSGAYGIPQALPGGKMASAGADWETNPATQISWGLGYVSGRYGTPCGAWGHSVRTGWY